MPDAAVVTITAVLAGQCTEICVRISLEDVIIKPWLQCMRMRRRLPCHGIGHGSARSSWSSHFGQEAEVACLCNLSERPKATIPSNSFWPPRHFSRSTIPCQADLFKSSLAQPYEPYKAAEMYDESTVTTYHFSHWSPIARCMQST